MKIIKPQQLVLLNNAYQLERNSFFGFSITAGIYIDKVNHFITEPEIWDVWNKSPKSIQYLDMPFLKQFAEYVLVGHAGIGQEVDALDAEIRVGSLKKQWRIFGEGTYVKRKKFYSISMDHHNVWGGASDKNNPLGKGNIATSNAPNVILRKGDELYMRESLASPSPIPFNFSERKKYIDAITSIMSTKQYLNYTYPGYPKEFDLRYYQNAAPDQWITSHSWPAGTSFYLEGFANTDKVIKGTLPKVVAKAFGIMDDKIKEEIPLLLQTLWFVPDFNVIFMIYTGEVPIKELTQYPYDALLVSLEEENSQKNIEYYNDIYTKRLDKDTNLAALLDIDLMPKNAKLNVISSMDKHPTSMFYKFGPMDEKEVDAYYQKIKEDLKAVKKAVEQEKNLPDVNNLPKIEYLDVFSLTDETKFFDKNFKEFYSWNLQIIGKEFNNCNFKNIDFIKYEFISCTFNDCNFNSCYFNDNLFKKVILNDSKFNKCNLQNVKFLNSDIKALEIIKSKLKEVIIQDSEVNESSVGQSGLAHIKFIKVNLMSVKFIDTKIRKTEFLDSILDTCTFKNTVLTFSKFTESKIDKVSILDGTLKSISFDKCFIFSFSVGFNTVFEKCSFSDNWMEKIGLGNIKILKNKFEYCNFKEFNGSFSDFSGSIFSNCDMMTAVFKDSILINTRWTECSSQQGIFYNANLEDTILNECNLVGSNFSLITKNENTKFRRCLLEKVLWIPFKESLTGTIFND